MAKTTIIYATKDTSICSSKGSEAFNFGKQPNIFINNTSKILIYFDLSLIPANAIIISAKLHLYLYRLHSTTPDDSTYITIMQLNDNFYENIVTSLTSPGSFKLIPTDTSTLEIFNDNLNKIITFDKLTNTVSSWYSNVSSNHGFELSTSTPYTLSFFSREFSKPNLQPSLEVEYTMPTYKPFIDTNISSKMVYLDNTTAVKTDIYDISRALFFTYLIDNSVVNLNIYEKSDYVSVYLQTCDTINGVFENLGNLIYIAPDTNKSIEVSAINKYIRLSIKGTPGTRINITTFLKSLVTLLPSSISSCKIDGDKIILTMTQPLTGETSDITAFTVTTPDDFKDLPEIKIIKILVFDNTVTLICSDTAIFFSGTTLSYKSNGINNLTGLTGDVLNFTNQPLILDTPLVIYPKQEIILQNENQITTIYDFSKSLSFKYSIKLIGSSNAILSILASGSKSKDFEPIGDEITLIPNTSVIAIKLEEPYKYVRLSVKLAPVQLINMHSTASLNINDSINTTNSINIANSPDILPAIEITPIYTALPNKIPGIPLNLEVINNGSNILLTMSNPLTTTTEIGGPQPGKFIIIKASGEYLSIASLTISSETINFALTTPIFPATSANDRSYITYEANGINDLKDINGDIDNFTNYEIDQYLPIIDTTEIIIPLIELSKSDIYDFSIFISFKYIINNSSKSNAAFVTLKQCDTRDGTFNSIGDELSVAPNSSLEILPAPKNKYICLSIRNPEFLIEYDQISITAHYTAYSDNLPSIVKDGAVINADNKIILTMTKPLIGKIANINSFTINPPKDYKDLPSIKILEVLVSSYTVTLSCVDTSIFFPGTTISYKSNEINNLTSAEGAVFSFSNHTLIQDTPIVIYPKQEFIPYSGSPLTTIYDVTKSLYFKYYINLIGNCTAILSILASTDKNATFKSIEEINLIPNTAVICIKLESPYKYVRLEVKFSTINLINSLSTELVNTNITNPPDKIFITPVYTALPDKIPGVPIKGIVTNNGSTIILTFTNSLFLTETIENYPLQNFIINRSSKIPIYIEKSTVSSSNVILTLTTPIIIANSVNDRTYITYEGNGISALTDNNGFIDNFTSYEIEQYLGTVDISEIIIPKNEYSQSDIYDFLKFISLTFTIANSSQSNSVFVTLQHCTSINGPFAPLGDELPLTPNSPLEITPTQINEYICLSIRNPNYLTNSDNVSINAHYTAYSDNIPATVINGSVSNAGSTIILTMTKPLNTVSPAISVIGIFTISTSFTTDITITELTVLDTTVTLILNKAIKTSITETDSMTLTYKGTPDTNYLTTLNGNVPVANFTAYKIALNIKTITTSQTIKLLATNVQSTIYDTSRALLFNYTITNNSTSSTLVTPKECATRAGEFTTIPDKSVTITTPSPVVITLETDDFVCLSFEQSSQPNEEISLTTKYTCFSDTAPSTVAAGKFLKNKFQIILTMSNKLTMVPETIPRVGIFNITTSLGKAVTISNLTVLDNTVTLTLKEDISTTTSISLTYTSTDDINYLKNENGNIDNFTNYPLSILEVVEVVELLTPELYAKLTTIYNSSKASFFEYSILNENYLTALVQLMESDNTSGPFIMVPGTTVTPIYPNTLCKLPVIKTKPYICLSIYIKFNSNSITTNTNTNTILNSSPYKDLVVTAHYEALPSNVPSSPKCGYAYGPVNPGEEPFSIKLRMTKPLDSIFTTDMSILSSFTISLVKNSLPVSQFPIMALNIQKKNNQILELILNKDITSKDEFIVTYKATDVSSVIKGDNGTVHSFTNLPISSYKNSDNCK